MSLEKEKISFSYPIISITAEGARSWGWWCGLSHGLVLSGDQLVLRVPGLKVKESRLDCSSRLIVLGVSESGADIKPLARELGRSQELVMEPNP